MASRDPAVRRELDHAAWEETEHLNWTETRIAELGGRKSLLNPLWYGGSLAIGIIAGKCGDAWSLGFLAETERQVEGHLEGHKARLPAQDRKSWEVLEQMKQDEMRHADTAVRHGARDLPPPVKAAMQLSSTGDDPTFLLDLTAVQASITSKLWVISAVLPSMIEAEQYFSAESATARSTASGFRLCPLTRKCMLIRVNTLGSVSARSACNLTSQPET
jgi:hypothetical protein